METTWYIVPTHSGKTYCLWIFGICVDGQSHQPRATDPLLCSLWGQMITHSFLIIYNLPNCVIRQGYHSQIMFFFFYSSNSFLNFPSPSLGGLTLSGSSLLNTNWVYFPIFCEVNELCQSFGRNHRDALTDGIFLMLYLVEVKKSAFTLKTFWLYDNFGCKR